MERDHSPRLLVWVVVTALIAGVAGGLVGATMVHFFNDDVAPALQAATTVEQRQVTLEEDSAITDAVDKAVPSVVTIVNKMEVSGGFGLETEETAAGSGVIVDGRGYIVTNEHVVHGAAEISVVLHDGREFPAALVSSDDPFTDLAVIKIDPGTEELPALAWGDSDALKLGQRVVAIGSALSEFRDSVTVGVVSGSHRNWSREGVVMEDLIQTDAAVNHGNSGGALINAEGELVGLNTSVIRSTEAGETVEGIAFAISSKVAEPIAQTIIDQGSYPRAYLGIVHQDITPDVSALGDLPVDHGALVVRVSPQTPAADAGIKEGDIILKMGDTELSPDMPFLNALGRLQPGQPVALLIDRAGAQTTVLVTPSARDRTTG
jgi:S1-C subfamily serine protease